MPRNRVLSFMSQLGSKSPTLGPSSDDFDNPPPQSPPREQEKRALKKKLSNIDTYTPTASQQKLELLTQSSPNSPSTPSRARADSRTTGRPNSMIQTWQPPQMDVANDTPPELQPIFSYLNSHSNKLYQEGYFLKLHDLDSRGRPSQDRVWNECFAQLVGTVLSLWDAAALDVAGEDGEVVPTFINLSDASLKMIESLPMNGAQGDNLQNVLSISTAANNRYLLHFNSLNSLTQWTAGIRLAIFEHSTLQEAYTGSLIAGKGKYLNNIKQIMERSKFPHEDWARVRFGAGTPWKRCWCVISPPDEKDFQKAQKIMKKGSAFSRPQLPKGDIKFYDTRRVNKKTKPIATITDAYAAYAIYPQSKPLIDQSTLVKLEGLVTVHSSPETTTEGFVFVMPEVHPAVSGFEMMLRWLFPVFDTFCLYGRPTRLIADTLDQRGLMFAMPRDRRYGYLDILDVSSIIHTSGSQNWSERQWRKEMKKLTSTRMTTQMDGAPLENFQPGRRNPSKRTSMPAGRGLRFEEGAIHSSPGSRTGSPAPAAIAERLAPRRTDSAPIQASSPSPHKRSVSDARGYRPSRLSYEAGRQDDYDQAPTPPRHGGALGAAHGRPSGPGSLARVNSGDEIPTVSSYDQSGALPAVSPYLPPPEPVITPPAFTHTPNSRPPNKPYQAPELRRAHSNVDAATLFQMQEAIHTDPSNPPDVRGLEPPQYQPYPGGPSQRSSAVRNARSQSPGGRYASNSNPNTRDMKRLSMIPGSPFVHENGEYFASPQDTTMSQMDALMARSPPVDDAERANRGGRPPMVPQHSSSSISRKPVPRNLPQVPPGADQAYGGAQASQVRSEEPLSPTSPVGSFVGALIDQDALERILNTESDRATTMSTIVSSTPDYASTASHSSRDKKPPVEKPRAGKLKTVGDPDMPTTDPRSGGAGRYDTYNRDIAEQSADLPNIDFGPTFSYKPNPRPAPTTAADNSNKRRSRSIDRLRNASQEGLSDFPAQPSNDSPNDENRRSYFGGRTTPTGLESSEQPSNRQSIVWTPGSASPGGGISNRQSLTPEQWVQYRAQLAAQTQQVARKASPSYAHQRTDSSSPVQQWRNSMTKTPPPLVRTASGDWTQSRKSTPPSRPHSRGASVYLNQGSPGAAASANLSAKEQMHVSRATGTPLVNLASSAKSPQHEQSAGLVGAIEAREMEKAAIKDGLRSEMVQQAIMARQQQQLFAQQEAEGHPYYTNSPEQPIQYQQMANHKASFSGGRSFYNDFAAQQTRPSMQAQNSWRQSFGPGSQQHMRSQSGVIGQQQQPQQQRPYSPQAGGFGGAYVQQQGMMGQSQNQYVNTQQQQVSGTNAFQQQQGGQWQQRR